MGEREELQAITDEMIDNAKRAGQIVAGDLVVGDDGVAQGRVQLATPVMGIVIDSTIGCDCEMIAERDPGDEDPHG